ncbi:unnamed protein product, partial [Owenia fusiformis]
MSLWSRTDKENTSSENIKRKSTDADLSQEKKRFKKESVLCEKCGKTFRNNFDLNRHMKSHREYMCTSCTRSFDCRNALKSHMFRKHSQSGGAEPDQIEQESNHSNDEEVHEQDHQPWENEDGEIDQDLKQIYESHGRVIKLDHSRGTIQDVYNFHLADGQLSYNQVNEQLNEIFNEQKHVFKISLSLGFVLRNIETNQLRYFYPHNNEGLLSSPILISDTEDLEELKRKLNDLDFINLVFKLRPNTKWS